jgi:hypothetical protein
MSKNRIKSLRDITVDGEVYKWTCLDGFKIWKNKQVIYHEGWGANYPNVYYGEDNTITPRIVAKIIRLINGTEILVSTEDFNKRFESSSAIGYYDRYTSFEDKRIEYLFFNLNQAHEELGDYLKEQKVKDENIVVQQMQNN